MDPKFYLSKKLLLKNNFIYRLKKKLFKKIAANVLYLFFFDKLKKNFFHKSSFRNTITMHYN